MPLGQGRIRLRHLPAWFYVVTVIAETIPALAALSPEEKILLAAELWQQAVGGREAVEPNPELIEALRERLAHYHSDPEQTRTWEEVRQRIQGLREKD